MAQTTLHELKNIILMKYGTHAFESPDDITRRKEREVKEVGMTFWGYGGNICHPASQVQPFLERNRAKNEDTFLVLVKSNSVWNKEVCYANWYSEDNAIWKLIPDPLKVSSSKFALICSSFVQCDILLNLTQYEVPVGNSKGRRLSDYISGRITKGCGSLSISKGSDYPTLCTITHFGLVENSVFLK